MAAQPSLGALMARGLVKEFILAGARQIKLSFSASMQSLSVQSDVQRTRGYELCFTPQAAVQAMTEEIVEAVFLLLLPCSDIACIIAVDQQKILNLMPHAQRPLTAIPLIFPSANGQSEWTLDVSAGLTRGSLIMKAYINKSTGQQLLYVNTEAAINVSLELLLQDLGYLIMISCSSDMVEVIGTSDIPPHRLHVTFVCEEAHRAINSFIREALTSMGLGREPVSKSKLLLQDGPSKATGLASSKPSSKRISLQAAISNCRDKSAEDEAFNNHGTFSTWHEGFDSGQGHPRTARLSPFFGPSKGYRKRLAQLLPPIAQGQPNKPPHLLSLQPTFSMLSSSCIIGQLDRKFIVMAVKGITSLKILFVDQHAASERLQLDDLISKIKLCLPTGHSRGAYLHPFALDSIQLRDAAPIFLSSSEADSWSSSPEIRSQCEKWGWRLSQPGTELTHVPALFGHQLGIDDFKEYLHDQLEGLKGSIPKRAMELLRRSVMNKKTLQWSNLIIMMTKLCWLLQKPARGSSE
jgi:hypothetical protein